MANGSLSAADGLCQMLPDQELYEEQGGKRLIRLRTVFRTDFFAMARFSFKAGVRWSAESLLQKSHDITTEEKKETSVVGS